MNDERVIGQINMKLILHVYLHTICIDKISMDVNRVTKWRGKEIYNEHFTGLKIVIFKILGMEPVV